MTDQGGMKLDPLHTLCRHWPQICRRQQSNKPVSEISAHNRERIGFGIACALLGMFGMAMMDGCAKLLSAGYAISQIVLVRNAISVLAVPVFIRLAGSSLAPLRCGRLDLIAWRTLTNLGAGFLFFTGLRYLPLADAFAITFAAPFLITALSVPYLGERVGMRRWIAVIVGFIGVVIVIQPGTASFRIEALFPLGAALSYAMAMLIGRKMTREMSTSAIMFWPSAGAVLITLAMMPSQWQTPPLADFGLFIIMGLIGTLGMALITQGYRYAPAAVIAPFDYSVLIWGAILGWMIWHEAPGANIWIGSAVVMASGLYMVHRETKAKTLLRPSSCPREPTC
jgi:drug/metabolite transporter (DMT)-like permease